MEPKSSLNHGIPPDLNGHCHFGYGGTIITEENIIKIATPKQHPYSSHISQFAMFPSFRSPDDHETGVRAASQHFLNPLIPNNAPDVTLLKKTIGGPYRHEVLETPMKNRKKAVTWTGEHGFLDPLKGEKQVFYPTPPKTILPNPKLRDQELSLSERTSNMLKNLERTQWVTSYQMHHTGSGPANPLMIDDFKEKICNITGMNTHTPLVKSLRTFRSSEVKEVAGIESNAKLSSRAASEQEMMAKGRELPGSTSNSCILPRPPILPGIRPVDRVGIVGKEGRALCLRDLQNEFSKSKAHRDFNCSITHAAVNLRDNVVTGKKHDFYGINCYYLHG
uniref:Uncharacterized protein n=1 Tax=Cyclopterus lumpus TaxID=8103 RepID=A0A8C2XB57_CYCLU